MVKLEDFPQVARDWKREFPIGNRVPVIVPHRLHRSSYLPLLPWDRHPGSPPLTHRYRETSSSLKIILLFLSKYLCFTITIYSDTVHMRLGYLLHSTLNETDPLTSTLKQSESKLRDIHTELKQAYPGSKHELDLEFTGCLQATRIAAGKFDSLRADIRSAVDSLIASGDNIQTLTQDARHATQMARREQYLDQLTTRMQSKVDSLSNDLATLDDHLESIGTIVARESKQSKPSSSIHAPGPNNPGPEPVPQSDQPPRLRTFVNSLLGVNLPAMLRPITAEPESAVSSPDPSLADLFREASTNHRPVIQVVRNLSNQLQILQQRRNIVI
ncbi:hypothetical protein CBS63078_4759 [Aspergillus niger]|nr:hypothetical protein CBS12448_7303 [Aspergillus niger]KAI2907908.1 hypothetical protein CBS63078_4759 [Aspergillus niger]KAI2949600.1 hypothetical protein CBS147321_1934 [Aspergillus niger]KAI2963002.1 hypothetical protein CBS147323_6987 [Aspergillus niger]KAI3006011.1 hypothetical protein CBS147346_4038 [Aspergillus niger]